jgi:hypothetical protein
MILSGNKNRAFWICAAMTILNAMVSAGFAVATVVQDSGNSPALYALSRSLALFAVAIGAAVFKSKPAVAALAVAMVLVQLADTGIGNRHARRQQNLWASVPGAGNSCGAAADAQGFQKQFSPQAKCLRDGI